jgi:hypothetical protein
LQLYYKTHLSKIISQIKFIIMNRLATYTKHAKVTHAIYEITSCHDNKIVNVIQESSITTIHMVSCLHLNSENKPHSYPRLSWRFESIVTLQGKITWQHDTCEPWRQHEWLPFAMTIKELGWVLPHSSAVFHVKTSLGSLWVAQTLSLLIIHEAR